jgi:hypothetical protein
MAFSLLIVFISGCAAFFRSVSLPPPEGSSLPPKGALRHPFSPCKPAANVPDTQDFGWNAGGADRWKVRGNYPGGVSSSRRRNMSSRDIPAIRTTFLRPLMPETICTRGRGIPSLAARNRTSASLARLSRGGAVRRMRTASPKSPATLSLDARGSTWTATVALSSSRPASFPLFPFRKAPPPGRRASSRESTGETGWPGSPPSGRSRSRPPSGGACAG